MLQTNCNNNNNLDSQGDIVKRLEKLSKWQEEQKRLLDERQNIQRKMLGMEQKNMYELLGLFHSNEVIDSEPGGAGDLLKDVSDLHQAKTKLHHETELDREITAMEKKLFEGVEQSVEQVRKGGHKNFDDIGSGAKSQNENVSNKKRTFLRRGEGIKQRFKISPEALRINNLPRYKYVTTHPKVKKTKGRRVSTTDKPKKEDMKNCGSHGATNKKSNKHLDFKEKHFQQILLESKGTCSSTPDSKSSTSTMKSALSVSPPELHFGKEYNKSGNNEITDGIQNDSQMNFYEPLTWSKVLDSQQIKPIKLERTKQSEEGEITGKTNIEDSEDDNLSIFELIERQAADGTLDMNSSCIKKFLHRKAENRKNENEDENEQISHLKQFTETGLRPAVENVLRPDTSDDAETSDFDKSATSCEAQKISNYLIENTKPVTASNDDKDISDTRINFLEGETSSFNNPDLTSDMSTLIREDNDNTRSSDLFNQFKNALFAALTGKNDSGGTNSDAKSVLPSPPSALTQELQEKSNLIKSRLEELEKEIYAFKNNNMELMRAKQEYEMERAHFNQERTEAIDKLKDEKIQMEMYLHDERMKIETERRKSEHRVRVEKMSAVNKDKKEILRLKNEVESLQLQIKQREQVHGSAQARLRVQIRNYERDQKQLLEEIDRLTKENKRLQGEKQRLEREGSNKMLQEINKNLAKLKLASLNTTNSDNTNTRSQPQTTNSTSQHPKTYGKPIIKTETIFKAPPNSRNSSNTDVSFVENESSNNLDEKTSGTMVGTYECDADLEDEDDDFADEICAGKNNLSSKNAKAAHKLKNLNNVKPTTSGQRIMKNQDTNNTEISNNDRVSTIMQNKQKEPPESGTNESFRREIINPDGSKDIWYPNGNLKKISSDGMNIRMLYFNRDVKETNITEGTVKYYYAETNTWHTTYLDGLEIFEFPNGQIEHKYKNGKVEIHFPDHSVKIIDPTDHEKEDEWRFVDGTNLIQMRNGDKILMLPNGQKEIHTKFSKRREYPDGTVKTVYPDGSQETRYSNGRIRLKDKDGKLIMDSERN